MRFSVSTGGGGKDELEIGGEGAFFEQSAHIGVVRGIGEEREAVACLSEDAQRGKGVVFEMPVFLGDGVFLRERGVEDRVGRPFGKAAAENFEGAVFDEMVFAACIISFENFDPPIPASSPTREYKKPVPGRWNIMSP